MREVGTAPSFVLWTLLVAVASVGVSCSPSPDSTGATPAAAAPQSVAASLTPADDASIDARARETEAKMTDDERFALLVSLIGAIPSMGVPRDKRIPETVTNMSAGYTPGIARLAIP